MDDKIDNPLTVDLAISILRDYGCDLWNYYKEWSRLDHCVRVSKYSSKIATRIMKAHPDIKINFQTTVLGALLHDLAVPMVERGEILPIQHGYVAGKILRTRGWEEIARIAECHIGSGITLHDIIENKLPLPYQDFLPQTIEEKIVTFADKIDAIEYLEADHTRLIQEIKNVDDVWTRFKELEAELDKMAQCRIREIEID